MVSNIVPQEKNSQAFRSLKPQEMDRDELL